MTMTPLPDQTPATVLVTGATGTVGRHVVVQLLDRGHRVRAMTRAPERAALPTGAEVVRGDLTDLGSVRSAVAGVDAVHLITFDGGTGEGLSDGPALVAAIADAGVERVTVLAGWDESTVEPALRASTLAWTLLHPVEFMGNALEWAADVVAGDEVRTLADWPSAMVHEADIAAVAVTSLTEPGHGGRTYALTGPQALTPAERVAALSEAVGRPLRWVRSTEAEERERLRGYGYDEEYVEFGSRSRRSRRRSGRCRRTPCRV